MRPDDLEMLFETERKLLARRLREFLPSRRANRAGESPSRKRRSAARRRGTPRTADGCAAGGRGSESPPRARAGGLATQRGPGGAADRADRRGPLLAILRRRERRRRREREERNGSVVYALISGVFHLALVAILIPHLQPPPPPPPEPESALVIRFVPRALAKAPTPATPPPPAPKPPEATPTPTVEAREEHATPPEEKPPVPVETPEPADPVIPAVPSASDSEPLLGTGGGGHPSTGGPLGSRRGEHSQALRVFGGDTETERAVRAGLAWLALHQDEDGSWDAARFHKHCPPGRPCTGPGYEEYRVGVTALALLAFLGAGVDGAAATSHREVVRLGLDYLLSVQDEVGCFGVRDGHYMYNHAIAAFCVAEAFLLTKEKRYQGAAERGLDFSARCQQPGGGWDYGAARTLRNDLSVTGWQVMAIHTAAQGGLVIDPTMERRLDSYLRRAVHRSGWSTYADRGTGAGRGGVSMAAVGLLCRLYTGWSPRSRDVLRSAEIIVRHRPDGDARVDWEQSFQSSYYWYYATLALFHVGGEYWEAWNTFLKREVLPLQSERHHRKGSWDPDPNWIGAGGGRIATTALNVLSFEVYYRYTPLHVKYGSRRKDRGER